MPIPKAVFALAVALGAQASGAATDPLHSPECTAARAALEAALAGPAQALRDRPELLVRTRKQVADLCLGHASSQGQRTGAPEPPIAIPAPVVELPRMARPPAVVPAPATVAPRSVAITACDPAGCWDSDGRRLNAVGPLLLGPRGVCVPLAGQATCP